MQAIAERSAAPTKRDVNSCTANIGSGPPDFHVSTHGNTSPPCASPYTAIAITTIADGLASEAIMNTVETRGPATPANSLHPCSWRMSGADNTSMAAAAIHRARLDCSFAQSEDMLASRKHVGAAKAKIAE